MLDKFKKSVKDFSSDVKSKVAEKEIQEEDISSLLEDFRLQLLQNNVSLETVEKFEKEIKESLVGEEVRRGKVEQKVEEAVKNTLEEVLDDSFDLQKQLDAAEEPPIVFLIGFNGSGKCVTGDTYVYTGDGPVKAEDLYKRFEDLETKETEKGEYVEPENLKTHSINTENLESDLKPVSKLWRLNTEKLVDIETSMGKQISVTPEHPFFRITEGAIVKQSADTLSKDDYIMVPEKIMSNVDKYNFWENMPGEFYVSDENLVEDLYEKIAGSDKTLDEVSHNWTEKNYSENSIQSWRRSKKVPLEVLREFGIEISETCKFSAPQSEPLILPKKPSKELAEWLGMFIAEGNIDNKSIHIHNENQKFVGRVKELYSEIFGVEPTVRKIDGLYRVSLGKSTLERFFEESLGLEDSKYSLVDTLLTWPEEHKTAFLRGFFSGDGHINKNKREIGLTTSNRATAEKISMMLLEIGIISSIGQKNVNEDVYHRIRINGNTKLRKWQEKIGFVMDYKNKDLNTALEQNKQYEHTKLVPNQGAVLKQVRKSAGLTQEQIAGKLGVGNTMVSHYETGSRVDKKKLNIYSQFADDKEAEEFLERLANGDVSWVKIRNIKKRETEEKVYDLTVPESHNFIANGLVVHNTTTAAKLASQLKDQGVVLGAGDTFRAASIEQLKEHGENIGVEVIAHDYESDPAAVGYDTVENAEKNNRIALVDTAGRSHSDQNLMDELGKMVRVNNPDITFLVVDALAGNDVLEQAEAYEGMFDAIIVTKMDVDENGGAIISLSERSGKPVAFIGTGQDYDDLEEFDKEEFIEKILE